MLSAYASIIICLRQRYAESSTDIAGADGMAGRGTALMRVVLVSTPSVLRGCYGMSEGADPAPVGSPISLRACYAKSGTDVACVATSTQRERPEYLVEQAKYAPGTRPLPSYALPMRCPVLRCAALLPDSGPASRMLGTASAFSLRTRCALSGTNALYCQVGSRARDVRGAAGSTATRYGPSCYAKPGTDLWAFWYQGLQTAEIPVELEAHTAGLSSAVAHTGPPLPLGACEHVMRLTRALHVRFMGCACGWYAGRACDVCDVMPGCRACSDETGEGVARKDLLLQLMHNIRHATRVWP
eukprot:3941199-Rhodomonas_salina.2